MEHLSRSACPPLSGVERKADLATDPLTVRRQADATYETVRLYYGFSDLAMKKFVGVRCVRDVRDGLKTVPYTKPVRVPYPRPV
jgi:hypothetical protein